MEELVKKIVVDAEKFKDKFTDQKNIPVYYACIFCQTDDEYNKFIVEAYKIGKKVEEKPNSFLFRISPIETSAGKLELIRVRQPHKAWPERGDADFVVNDYKFFKEKYLNQPGFTLIPRNNSEMIELYKKGENVRVYFSSPLLINELQSL